MTKQKQPERMTARVSVVLRPSDKWRYEKLAKELGVSLGQFVRSACLDLSALYRPFQSNKRGN